MLRDYAAAVERVQGGTDPMGLTAKLMMALLKVQYDRKVASNSKKAVVSEMLASAMAQRPLDLTLNISNIAPTDDGESEEEGDDEGEFEMSDVEEMEQ